MNSHRVAKLPGDSVMIQASVTVDSDQPDTLYRVIVTLGNQTDTKELFLPNGVTIINRNLFVPSAAMGTTLQASISLFARFPDGIWQHLDIATHNDAVQIGDGQLTILVIPFGSDPNAADNLITTGQLAITLHDIIVFGTDMSANPDLYAGIWSQNVPLVEYTAADVIFLYDQVVASNSVEADIPDLLANAVMQVP